MTMRQASTTFSVFASVRHHGLLFLSAVLLLPWGSACGGARPYRAMAKAATSEENVMAQADDKRLKAHLREALLTSDPTANATITPYAYMGHAFLVGYVSSATQREGLVSLAKAVEGVQSLDTYLPDKPADAGASRTASDLEIKGKVKAAITADPSVVTTRVEIESLDGHVVLLGVLSSQEAIETAMASARQVSGVTGVTNFLLLPEAEYERRRPSLR